MRIALTYTPQNITSAPEADLDAPSTIDAIEAALRRAGHEVERVEATKPLSQFVRRLEAIAPEVVFNRAVGSNEQTRTTFFPALFDELGIPHTSADALPDRLRQLENPNGSIDERVNNTLQRTYERYGIGPARSPTLQKPQEQRTLRIGFIFNLKRTDDEAEAEFDSPETIQAIAQAIENLGHTVIYLEATPDLLHRLPLTKPDLVFNFAEGFRGRGREAQVPALLDLLGIPYSGSDATTMSLCLDKGLTKQILRAANIGTPEWQVLTTGYEKLKPLRYPLIVKPNAEGTSKGITRASVVHDEAAARSLSLTLIQRYAQPVVVEEYIVGREFTVGVLGHTQPRALAPMEFVFLNDDETPVYGYYEKQKWRDYMRWDCPATLTEVELLKIQKTAFDAFTALSCRDVARIDMRLARDGTVYVLECNPVPGLVPDYSDLCNIAARSGMDYPELISEILAGCIQRFWGENTPI